MSPAQNTAPLFDYHMPNYSFPGVPPAGLFDHLVYQIRGVGPETEPMLPEQTADLLSAAGAVKPMLGGVRSEAVA
jgi:hypothetical protein